MEPSKRERIGILRNCQQNSTNQLQTNRNDFKTLRYCGGVFGEDDAAAPFGRIPEGALDVPCPEAGALPLPEAAPAFALWGEGAVPDGPDEACGPLLV